MQNLLPQSRHWLSGTRTQLLHSGKLAAILHCGKIFGKLSSAITWKVDQMVRETKALKEKVKKKNQDVGIY